MWLADNWKDYEVLDTSNGEKLERWGNYLLVRPDPQVVWNTPHTNPGWKKKNGHYHRSSKGGGEWEFFSLPQQWSIHYGKLTFQLKPFSFKHTGLFPEQAANWDWFSNLIQNANRPIKVLNLFAYTGGATLAAAAAGASVTHVDASKGMVAWAKENAASSGLSDAPIRWIVDDCQKFVEREIRRGNHYDAIIMIRHLMDADLRVKSGKLRMLFIHSYHCVHSYFLTNRYFSLLTAIQLVLLLLS